MVPILTILVLLLGSIIIVAVPAVAFFQLRKRANRLWIPLIAGGLGFFILQIVIRIPLLQYVLPLFEWYNNLSNIMLILFLAFTAGLFETIARFVTMKVMMKHDTRFTAGIAHGIGHGATEAVLLVGLNFAIYGVIAIWMRTTSYESIVSSNDLLASSMELLENVLIETPWYEFILGIMERVSTMVVHIGLSVLMIYGFHKKEWKYVVFTLLIHTFVDFSAVGLLQLGVNTLLIELYILLLAILSVIIIKRVYNEYNKERKTIKEVTGDA